MAGIEASRFTIFKCSVSSSAKDVDFSSEGPEKTAGRRE
jgi:hypothetical protein